MAIDPELAMTKDFPRLPSPHPEERKLAELRAAPLIGKLILSWTELERDMNRAILNGRNIKEWKHPPDRKLSRFQDNLNEWIKLFLGSHENEKAKEIRAETKRLQQIRNDIAHNIWMVRLDTTLGVAINIVQENWKFWEEEAQWGKRKRNKPEKDRPETYRTTQYLEAFLLSAIHRIDELVIEMRTAEAHGMRYLADKKLR
ncbi:MAG TPA: hypothetical protein VM715_12135 [Candidatus Acidoferrum sp.]|nr:hypothetical protein [Candidatus Acidoferrum sp.]